MTPLPRLPDDRPLGSDPTITIALASYQGATFIGRQLASIAAQTHRNWQLIVSDDGSTDGTPRIVRDFSARYPCGQVRLIEGLRKGATRNFLHLIGHVPAGRMMAFCDQDDLWLDHKLARAVRAISALKGPAHYAARTIITDPDLNPVGPSRHFHRPLGFRNALVQACMAGNTSVFNAAAVDVLQRSAPAARDAGILSHDWWAYQVMAGVGSHLIHDPEPCLLYRQHAASEVGRNDTARALIHRARRLLSGSFGQWMACNLQALNAARELLTTDACDVLDRIMPCGGMRGPMAALTFRRAGLYRQTAAGTAALYCAVGSGRLRQPLMDRKPSR